MRFIVSLVVVCVLVVTASVMAAESSDDDPPRTFAVWERPAVGVFIGVTANGDQRSGDSSPELGVAIETPVVFGWRVRADASRVSWLFGTRIPPAYRLDPGEAVGLDSLRLALLRVRHWGPRMAEYAGLGYGAYRYRYSQSSLHRPWRGGVHGVAGVEVADARQRLAFGGELRLHGIDGTGQPPVVSYVLFKLDAALGIKLRF